MVAAGQRAVEKTAGIPGFMAVDVPGLIETYNVTKGQLADATGVSYQALIRKKRLENKSILRTLRSLGAILNRVEPWAGSKAQAWAWFVGEPIPAFGYRTPQQVFKDNSGPEALAKYLDGISEGGYA